MRKLVRARERERRQIETDSSYPWKSSSSLQHLDKATKEPRPPPEGWEEKLPGKE